MKIEDQIAEEVVKEGRLVGPKDCLDRMKAAIASAIRKDRERAARIVLMAPLDMSYEQLAVLIRE
jgi:hypothetical protein